MSVPLESNVFFLKTEYTFIMLTSCCTSWQPHPVQHHDKFADTSRPSCNVTSCFNRQNITLWKISKCSDFDSAVILQIHIMISHV